MNKSVDSAEKNITLSVEQVIKILEEIIYSTKVDETLPKSVYENERLAEILLDLLEMRRFFSALTNGDLSVTLNMKGYTAGTLKMLQANLKHITWQTKMVASGDMTQRVDFMGEFSTAFNDMVRKLDDTLKSLKQKETELMQLNEDLTNEINRRKVLEQSLRESEEKYKSLSQIDPLTGIYNRRHFFILAQMEIEKALRYKRDLSLLMLDLDFFKEINDTYGHASGDKVLQMTAKTVGQNLRSVDIFARYGGEEFVIILPETNGDGALLVAERIRSNIEKTPFEIDDKVLINVTVSIGLYSEAIEKTGSANIDRLIERADQALYEAKRSGRNRVSIYTHPLP